MGTFDKRFSVTGQEIKCPIFFLNCFLRNISRYPTIILFFLADCFKFYKTRLLSANSKPFLIMVSPSSVWLEKSPALKVAPFYEEFIKLFR